MSNFLEIDKKRAWRQSLFVFFILSFFVCFLFRDTFEGMVAIWLRSETFTHGFFVAPIAIWLIWRKRALLYTQIPLINFWFLLPLLCVSFFWSLGNLAFVNSVTQLCAVALLVLIVPAIFGWKITSIIIFPLLFLFFSVPIGEFLFPQLMEWTANFTVFALRLSGVPVYREGLQFVIPSGNWSVVEACSGVRYLIASLTVGTLFAYLNYQSFLRRTLFILVSIVVPIFANWIRAYLIVMLGHFSGNKLAVGVDHIIYGWLFFGVVIIAMFMIGSRWAEPMPAGFWPLSESKVSSGVFNTIPLFLIFCLIGFVVCLPSIGQRFIYSNDESNVSRSNHILMLRSGWMPSSDASCAEFIPMYKNTSFEYRNCYSKETRNVGLYLGYYHQQSYERKLISSENVLVASNDALWAKVGAKRHSSEIDSVEFSVKATELRDISLARRRTDSRLLVWQVYWINGVFTENDHLAKIYGVMQKILGREDNSAVVILFAEDDEDKKSELILHDFLDENLDAIKNYLNNSF